MINNLKKIYTGLTEVKSASGHTGIWKYRPEGVHDGSLVIGHCVSRIIVLTSKVFELSENLHVKTLLLTRHKDVHHVNSKSFIHDQDIQ
jgi:hypothetical protein